MSRLDEIVLVVGRAGCGCSNGDGVNGDDGDDGIEVVGSVAMREVHSAMA